MGDFGVFQTSGMRTFQILRFAEKVIIPCNSPSTQFHIIQAAQDACASYLRTANASLRNKVELLHLKRLYYEARLCRMKRTVGA